MLDHESFHHRHIGPNEAEIAGMLQVVGFTSLDEFIGSVVPAVIRMES